MERKGKGRQKLAMVKMSNESNLQVTFSKRRSGLFKKASELSTLCGAEIAVVVFSPGKKVFSFGHPSVEAVVDRYLGRNLPQPSPTMQLIDTHRKATVRELNLQLTQVMEQLEFERKRSVELNQNRKANMELFWWHKPVDELNLCQTQQLKEALLQLKKNVAKLKDMIMVQNSYPRQQFFGSSSNQPVLPFNPNNNGGFNPDMGPAAFAPNQGFNNSGFGPGFF